MCLPLPVPVCLCLTLPVCLFLTLPVHMCLFLILPVPVWCVSYYLCMCACVFHCLCLGAWWHQPVCPLSVYSCLMLNINLTLRGRQMCNTLSNMMMKCSFRNAEFYGNAVGSHIWLVPNWLKIIMIYKHRKSPLKSCFPLYYIKAIILPFFHLFYQEIKNT